MFKLNISNDFRASMTWVHTWVGIGVSCLLFVIFWTGSLTVFDKEIDLWMKPEMRVEAPQGSFSFQAKFDELLAGEARNASTLAVAAPSERMPLGFYYWREKGGDNIDVYFNAATNAPVGVTESYAGTRFFYPFHYMLHIHPLGIGYWVVGFCAMATLVLIVSGIFIHRKIVADFFTFRPKKALRRSTLDLHNMSSLMALPLHILFPLTGLMIFFSVYLPWSSLVLFHGNELKRNEAVYGSVKSDPHGRPRSGYVDVEGIVRQVEEAWATRSSGGHPKADTVRLWDQSDTNAALELVDYFNSRAVSMNKYRTTVSIVTGEVIADAEPGNARSTFSWLAGAHYIGFDNWALRWLYFAGGLLGSLMVASGLMFWIHARIRKGAIEPRSVRMVRALTAGSVTGIILASGGYLVANRLIPAASDGFGIGRANFEVLIFYIVWIGAFIHAGFRGRFAWREQCLAIAPVAVLAVLLNWITTGDHPIAAALQGLTQIWSMDLTLLAGAGVALFAAAKTKVKAEEIKKAQREIGADMLEKSHTE